jgi:hypothetical protein
MAPSAPQAPILNLSHRHTISSKELAWPRSLELTPAPFDLGTSFLRGALICSPYDHHKTLPTSAVHLSRATRAAACAVESTKTPSALGPNVPHPRDGILPLPPLRHPRDPRDAFRWCPNDAHRRASKSTAKSSSRSGQRAHSQMTSFLGAM